MGGERGAMRWETVRRRRRRRHPTEARSAVLLSSNLSHPHTHTSQLARKFHPDVNKEAGAEEKFKVRERVFCVGTEE